MSKHFLFHCQFGGSFGWGHVVRLSALATEARKNGIECSLWTNSPVHELPDDISIAFSRVINAVSPMDYDVLILDHPHMGKKDVASVWPLEHKAVVALDDENKRDLSFASLILNTALTSSDFHYPSDVKSCLGPHYALMREPFQRATPLAVNERKGLVIIMGGTDVLNLLPKILSCLRNTVWEAEPITLVAQEKPDTAHQLNEALSHFTQAAWVKSATATQLAHIYSTSRYGITACGGVPYEMAACKLPFLGIEVAENQKYFSQALKAEWGIPVIDGKKFNRTLFLDKLEILMEYQPDFKEIDGHGTKRTLEAIHKTLLSKM